MRIRRPGSDTRPAASFFVIGGLLAASIGGLGHASRAQAGSSASDAPGSRTTTASGASASNRSSAPRPQTFFARTMIDSPIAIRLEAQSPSGRALHFAVGSPPRSGSLSLDGAVVTYTPARGFHGFDEFTYVVRDREHEISTPVQVLVARPHAGAVDRAFGAGGIAPFSFSSPTHCEARRLEDGDGAERLFVQRDDRIVSLGWRTQKNEERARKVLLVARHLPDGRIDEAFGEAGLLQLELAVDTAHVAAVGELADGALLVALQIGSDVEPAPGVGLHLLKLDAETGTPIPTRGARLWRIPVGVRASAMVIQRDGRVLIADGHRFAILRLTRELDLDSDYGEGGVYRVPLPASSVKLHRRAGIVDLYPLRDGRIQFVGHGFYGDVDDPRRKGSDWLMGRLLEDGTLDETFSRGEGVLVADFAEVDHPKNVFVGPGGEVIGAGHLGEEGRSFVFARFDADGELDRGFGDEGLRITGRDGPVVFPNRIVVDQRLGYVGGRNVSGGIGVQRFTRDGELDRSFGVEGQAVGHLGPAWSTEGSDDYWTSFRTRTAGVAIQSNGKIVALGTIVRCGGAESSGRDFALVRFWN